MTRVIRRRWDHEPSNLECKDPSRTKQSDKDETDVNNILARYMPGNDLSQWDPSKFVFADVSNIGDYLQCKTTIRDAEMAFGQLPAKVREFFENDPSNLVRAFTEPGFEDELRELGLLNPKPTIVSEKPSPATAPAAGPAPAAPAAGAEGAPAAPAPQE